MAICKDQHRYLPSLVNLPDSQAGDGRHKCAGCAYTQGYDDAIDGIQPNLREDEIKDSQAGTGRRKDVNAAYQRGYTDGMARVNTDPSERPSFF